MRAKGFCVAVAALLTAAAAVYIYFFTGPYRFVDRHLEEQSLQHLRASATTAPWRSSPSETTLEYLYFESAALYLDSVDAIAASMRARGGGITRQEALKIIGDIQRINPGAIVEDQSADNSTVATKSNLVLNKLIASGWLEEPERSDYQRQIFIDPNAEILLDAIRRIAQPDPAQFTGLLRIACNDLAHPDAVESFSWEDLRACLTNLD